MLNKKKVWKFTWSYNTLTILIHASNITLAGLRLYFQFVHLWKIKTVSNNEWITMCFAPSIQPSSHPQALALFQHCILLMLAVFTLCNSHCGDSFSSHLHTLHSGAANFSQTGLALLCKMPISDSGSHCRPVGESTLKELTGLFPNGLQVKAWDSETQKTKWTSCETHM